MPLPSLTHLAERFGFTISIQVRKFFIKHIVDLIILYSFNFTKKKIEKMEINWIIVAVVLICAIALILYLIKMNQKDKKEVTKFFNTDTTIRKESELDEDS